ncbi:hypothetical protein SU69_00920 [Thermosipho melanesiensis]|nr:hypothetical protein [Thermosipho melanesiensis]APT74800.1 hypothetical protein BW47_00950 [Thermosipho melanesiensis]OOC38643.1 hypothetical protein SU68_00920 [Thermosipho melanesiensis]OOC40447.1 hypothetical protein SU70_00920 [Thermosipho melanesiensis]OOC40712.1 hypothetical protein SU69_00920 [Thermosipho melanesiensis]OOC44558.1 hypothetical protein SU71_00910 [Thermosipho melanesiensis]
MRCKGAFFILTIIISTFAFSMQDYELTFSTLSPSNISSIDAYKIEFAKFEPIENNIFIFYNKC